jgi:asparagine synthase (glutamine-hydrolysing)
MCGIAGFFGVELDREAHDRCLERMLGRILHRGPDEQGYLVDGRAAIGNVRLSIIDLAHGSQPMSTPNGRWWIVFNGEAFNYKELRVDLASEGASFQTTCDTEVVLWGLALEGPGFLEKINGQFALCFYDRTQGSALLARDRLGERPLFYTRFDGGLLFASEVKAIAAYPGFTCTLDPVAIRDTMMGWSTVPGETCFRGVKLLEPGTFALYEDGEITTHAYAQLPTRAGLEQPTARSFEDCVVEIRDALTNSIRLRLRADLEVGAYVSGGLDSTIVAGVAQGLLDRRLRTFSIRFRGDSFDEGDYQSLVHRQIGSDHTEIFVGPEEYKNAFRDVVYHAEMPLYRLAPIPMYLLAGAVRDRDLKVVLTGEGADEFFLGYDLYRELLVRQAIEKEGLSDAEKSKRVQDLYPYLDHFRSDNVTGILRFFEGISGRTDDPLYGHRARHTIGRFGTRLLGKDVLRDAPAYEVRLVEALRRRHEGFDGLSSIEKAIVIESETLLSGYLLCSQGDRMSSAHAVEARYPFLDHEVVDTAARLPIDYRLRNGTDEKYILKKAFEDLVPKSILDRPKYPYRAPDGEMMLDREFRHHLPDPEEVEEAGIFDPTLVSKFLGNLSPEKMVQRELQALTTLVSSQMLYRFFTKGDLPAPRPLNNLSIRVDLRVGC